MWEYLELSWMSWPLALGTVKGSVMASNSSAVASLSRMYIKPGMKSLSTCEGREQLSTYYSDTTTTPIIWYTHSSVCSCCCCVYSCLTALRPSCTQHSSGELRASCAGFASHPTFLMSQGQNRETRAALCRRRAFFSHSSILRKTVQELMITA